MKPQNSLLDYLCFAPFAAEADLEKRLTAAELHLLSLRPEWDGIVVPSKFFGSLAAGRPSLYCGPEDSAVAEWIKTYRLGWVLMEDNLEEMVQKLLELADDPQKLAALQSNAYQAYQRYFSKKIGMDHWDVLLREALNLTDCKALYWRKQQQLIACPKN